MSLPKLPTSSVGLVSFRVRLSEKGRIKECLQRMLQDYEYPQSDEAASEKSV